MKFYTLIISCLLLLTACKNNAAKKDNTGIHIIPECKHQPAFVRRMGFDASHSALSTSERRTRGLVLKEFKSDNTVSRTFQAPGWSSASGMGPIVLDEIGNIYVSPAPVINVLDNDPLKQNIIYKVDAGSGEMKPYIDLPRVENPTPENAYGILAMTYDCETKILYVTSVSGSTHNKINGRIYSIRTGNNPKVEDILENTDACGVAIAYLNEEKRLFFGNARNSDILSVAINDKGQFSTDSRKEFSMAGMGPRGDDIARKIHFEKNGALTVMGIEFNFNLIAPTEKQETSYVFMYNTEKGTWEKQNRKPVLNSID
jgi:hypothetical protein